MSSLLLYEGRNLSQSNTCSNVDPYAERVAKNNDENNGDHRNGAVTCDL